MPLYSEMSSTELEATLSSLRDQGQIAYDAQAHAELSASYEIYTELYPQLQNSFWRLDALGGGPH